MNIYHEISEMMRTHKPQSLRFVKDWNYWSFQLVEVSIRVYGRSLCSRKICGERSHTQEPAETNLRDVWGGRWWWGQACSVTFTDKGMWSARMFLFQQDYQGTLSIRKHTDTKPDWLMLTKTIIRNKPSQSH